MTAGCLDEGKVMLFLEGTLSATDRTTVEAHLVACGACTELVTWAAADVASRSRAPGHEGQPFVGQLAPGSRVGRYQVLGAVGRGGMGEVYAAYHPDLDRRIALKVVYESGANRAERRTRLLQEAKAIARLSHPNVVTVHDAGTVGDRVFIAMEYLDGETVDVWLRSAKRGWQEILDAFLAAGRGLAAAHAANLVHRDFKPQNVMVGDGVVRVMDFGLARLVREGVEPGLGEGRDVGAGTDRHSDVGSPAITITRVTKTGALLGTPAYMAPEQFRGEAADARADQFSFCVALHEAIYGTRPVLAHLHERARDPAPAPPGSARPARAVAPVRLRRVLARGLQTDPAQRYPSMTALLAALERDPTRQRRRFGLALAALVLVTGVVVAGVRSVARSQRALCQGGAEHLATVWESGPASASRQKIQRAFAATGSSHAAEAFAGVTRLLDDYTTRWVGMYTDACKATHFRGEQSPEVLDLRMMCLQQRLTSVRALVDVLASADGKMVDSAVMAAGAVPDLGSCGNVDVLKAQVKPPQDDEMKKRVEALRRERARLVALKDTGRCLEAQRLTETLLPRVREAGYQPLVAETQITVGALAGMCADPTRGVEQLRSAFAVALKSHHDEAAAEAATELSGVLGVRLADTRLGRQWLEISQSMTARLGGHPRLETWQLANEAAILDREHRPEAALEVHGRALALKQRLLGKDHPDTLITALSIGGALVNGGRYEEALVSNERIRADVARVFGAGSSWVAFVANNDGESLNALHRHREARVAFEHALEVWRGAGADESLVAYGLTGLGVALVGAAEPEKAVAPLEEALRIRTIKEVEPEYMGEMRFTLARALWHRPASRQRAHALALSARADYTRVKGFDAKITAIDAWLRDPAAPAAQPSR
jgi:eukaryotic-like serine/threonine-protein kinase